jgi:hypothetical protein
VGPAQVAGVLQVVPEETEGLLVVVETGLVRPSGDVPDLGHQGPEVLPVVTLEQLCQVALIHSQYRLTSRVQASPPSC